MFVFKKKCNAEECQYCGIPLNGEGFGWDADLCEDCCPEEEMD